MAEDVFKNVQVLKGIPVDEFMGTMGVFTTSLSLCCGNCHTGAGTSNPKWEDDPPRKRTARAMISMVQDINKTRFGGRQVVTCWTCHRGQTSPSVTPPLDFAYGEAVVSPPDLLSRDPNATKTYPIAINIRTNNTILMASEPTGQTFGGGGSATAWLGSGEAASVPFGGVKVPASPSPSTVPL
jgi:hypothetical protein